MLSTPENGSVEKPMVPPMNGHVSMFRQFVGQFLCLALVTEVTISDD
jgi:hypothetical protein